MTPFITSTTIGSQQPTQANGSALDARSHLDLFGRLLLPLPLPGRRRLVSRTDLVPANQTLPVALFYLLPTFALVLAFIATWNSIGLHTNAGNTLLAWPGIEFSARPVCFYLCWLLFWLAFLRLVLPRLVTKPAPR